MCYAFLKSVRSISCHHFHYGDDFIAVVSNQLAWNISTSKPVSLCSLDVFRSSPGQSLSSYPHLANALFLLVGIACVLVTGRDFHAFTLMGGI